MACNPQAYLTLDKSQYAPGDSVRVTGSFFRGDANITVSIDRTGQASTVKTAANGSFRTTFALPANAGTGGYTVSAIGYESNGDVINGLPARASFSVGTAQAAPAQTSAPSTPSQQANEPATAPATGQPNSPQASQPATQARPAPQSSGANSFREPRVFPEPNVQTSRATGTTTRRSTSGTTTQRSSNGATPARADRATVGGRAVFGGSVAPVVTGTTAGPAVAAPTTSAGAPTRATGGTRSTARSGATSRATAERAATDDVWGSLSSGRSPSVLPVAGDGVGVSSPRPGSQLTLGLLLLGGGVLALVGGLAVGEARRRRVRVR